jgi:hypothetical protein
MRYIIGFLISIGLIILLFVLIFRGGSKPPTVVPLVSYANTDTVVEFTDDYAVSADQTHHKVTTVVGRDETTLTVEQGYQGTVIRNQSYNNNPTAYANFLRALEINGFNSGKDDPALRDERGACALGHRYIFVIQSGNRIIQRLWSSSCGNIGTFRGKTSTVIQLFKLQAPDYDRIVNAALTAPASTATSSSPTTTSGPL